MTHPPDRSFASVRADMDKLLADSGLERGGRGRSPDGVPPIPAVRSDPPAGKPRRRVAGGVLLGVLAIAGAIGAAGWYQAVERPDAPATETAAREVSRSTTLPQPNPVARTDTRTDNGGDTSTIEPDADVDAAAREAAPALASAKSAGATKSSERSAGRGERAPVRTAAVRSAEPRGAVPCERADDPELCRYREVLAADERLVRAYNEAVDAGVPTADLRLIRREWARARRGSVADPVYTVESYDDLASDLRNAAGEAAGDGMR